MQRAQNGLEAEVAALSSSGASKSNANVKTANLCADLQSFNPVSSPRAKSCLSTACKDSTSTRAAGLTRPPQQGRTRGWCWCHSCYFCSLLAVCTPPAARPATSAVLPNIISAALVAAAPFAGAPPLGDRVWVLQFQPLCP